MKVIRTIKLWRKYHKSWEELCTCCGKCCYERAPSKDGDVIIYYSLPCEHLDTRTRLCKIYDERFKKCNHCGKVRLSTALFNPTLPKDCPYVQIFRYGNDIEEHNERRI